MEEPSAHVNGIKGTSDIVNWLQFDSGCQLRYASQTGKVQFMDDFMILLRMDSLVLMITLSEGGTCHEGRTLPGSNLKSTLR